MGTLAVDAVLRLKGKPNLDYIQVIKKAGGSLKDSFLEEGFILEKKIGVGMPKVLENCKVCVANCQMDTDKIKILIDISKTQDNECGDGTTSVVVLASELLRNAQHLVEKKMHPQVIIKGYRAALAFARKKLESLAQDHGANEAAFREDLLKIAKTTLSSKLLKHEKDHFATLAVDAVLRLRSKPNIDYIQVIKK